jgi:peptide/nickel transport system permease protein
MTAYLIRRLLLVIPTLFGITILVFTLTRLAGNPADLRGQSGSNGGKPMTDEARMEMTKQYGWDKPPIEAYFLWLGKCFSLNFGTSFDDHKPVMEKIEERLPVTVSINIAAVIVIYGISIPLGIF